LAQPVPGREGHAVDKNIDFLHESFAFNIYGCTHFSVCIPLDDELQDQDGHEDDHDAGAIGNDTFIANALSNLMKPSPT
jgi:hypothetical protein